MFRQLDGIRTQQFEISYPSDHVMLLTLKRPKKLNCIDLATSREIQRVWETFDEDEDLWVAIITGTGRAFCTGADLAGILVMSKHKSSLEGD